jgi:mRNA degradation ribonuclease J1/J2
LPCSRPSSRSTVSSLETGSCPSSLATACKSGPFDIEFLRVTHSIPDCLALALHTPAGVIVHTGDFKIDQTPLDGQHFDLHRFAELGAEGVMLLLSDSTNADRRGHTGSERDVVDGFEELFSSAKGKLLVTTFSTSIYRLQILVDLARSSIARWPLSDAACSATPRSPWSWVH